MPNLAYRTEIFLSFPTLFALPLSEQIAMQTDTVTFEVTGLCLKHVTESVRNQTWVLIPYGTYRWLPSAQHRASPSTGLYSKELFEMSKYRARERYDP